MDTSTGHQLQDELVPDLVQYLATDVGHLAVKRLVSTVMSGSATQAIHLAITAAGLATGICVMSNKIAASVPVLTPLYTAALEVLKMQACILQQ